MSLRSYSVPTFALLLGACAVGTGSPPEAALTGGAEQVSAANLRDSCLDAYADGIDYFPEKVTATHAEGFRVSYHDHYKIVDVGVPDGEATLRYVLVQCGAPMPAVGGTMIEVPAQSAASLTTTNLPHLDVLDVVDRLVGVGNRDLVSTETVRDRIEGSGLPDLADVSGRPNLERVVDVGPDVLFMEAFGATVLEDVDRLADGGVAAAVIGGFNEETALARAEWVKFTALFFNAEGLANSAFDEISSAYRAIAERAGAAPGRPVVLANTPYEGTWFVPGGRSFFAAAIADAGGRYVFADNPSRGSVALDIETVLARGAGADVWVQAGSMHGSLADLLAADPRFAEFAAFRSGQVWAWDRRVTPSGGNALFELGHLRADLYLADLARVLHPDLFEDHDLVFYGQVPR